MMAHNKRARLSEEHDSSPEGELAQQGQDPSMEGTNGSPHDATATSNAQFDKTASSNPKPKQKRSRQLSVDAPHPSRKITACDTCRRLKIKCEVPESGPPCVRCKVKGIPDCKLQKSLQDILDSSAADVRWKQKIEQEMRELREQVQQLRNAAGMPLDPMASENEEEPEVPEATPDAAEEAVSQVPGLHLREVTLAPGQPGRPLALTRRTRLPASDIVARGILSQENAERLVRIYLNKVDPHLCSLVGYSHPAHESAKRTPSESIRCSSTLLLTAVCAIGSLHDHEHGHLFAPLYREFVRLCALQSFNRHQSLDDIRGLIVGSFYFTDLAWILTSTAVRITTERGMQEAFKRCSTLGGPGHRPVSQADKQRAFEEAIIYYQVYVADHQASIPHGRPPMTRQHAAVRGARQWLHDCELSNNDTGRLVSLVELWVIAHDVIDDFGVDVHLSLSPTLIQLENTRFGKALTDWALDWEGHWTTRTPTPLYAAKTQFDMQTMRLFLKAHVFRAPPGTSPLAVDNAPGSVASLRRMEMAQEAVASAHAVLRLVSERMGAALDDTSRMLGVPLNPFTMITFASVFLLKLSKTYGEGDWNAMATEDRIQLEGCTTVQVVSSVERALATLEACAREASPQYVAASIVRGLTSYVLETIRKRGLDDRPELQATLRSLEKHSDSLRVARETDRRRAADMAERADRSRLIPIDEDGGPAVAHPYASSTASTSPASVSARLGPWPTPGSGRIASSYSADQAYSASNGQRRNILSVDTDPGGFGAAGQLALGGYDAVSNGGSEGGGAAPTPMPVSAGASTPSGDMLFPSFSLDAFDLLSDTRTLSGLDLDLYLSGMVPSGPSAGVAASTAPFSPPSIGATPGTEVTIPPSPAARSGSGSGDALGAYPPPRQTGSRTGSTGTQTPQVYWPVFPGAHTSPPASGSSSAGLAARSQPTTAAGAARQRTSAPGTATSVAPLTAASPASFDRAIDSFLHPQLGESPSIRKGASGTGRR